MTKFAENSFVLAVSGPSGAGKSTLVHGLAAVLAPAVMLSYDEYYRAPDVRACDYRQWIQDGCDPDGFIRIPRLVENLSALRSGRGVITPGNRTVEAAPLVVLEEPWGRQRTEIAPLIDFVVHLDIPLDVSLARRLIRDTERGKDIVAYLKAYLEEDIRYIYAVQQRAGVSADLVVDGSQAPEALVGEVVRSVSGRLKHTIP